MSSHGSGISLKTPGADHVARAKALLAREGAELLKGELKATAASRVYDKLYSHLAPLVGDAGTQLLFMRSAKLTKGELAMFAAQSILEGTTKLRERLAAHETPLETDTAALFFGTFFTLITTLIGERLTAQVLRRAWPNSTIPHLGDENNE